MDVWIMDGWIEVGSRKKLVTSNWLHKQSASAFSVNIQHMILDLVILCEMSILSIIFGAVMTE